MKYLFLLLISALAQAYPNSFVTQLNVFNGETASGFTQGSLIFDNSGVLSQNNSNLFWNNSSFRLGIQTNTPLSPLQIGNPTGSYDTPIMMGIFSPSDSNEDLIIARNVTTPQELQLGVNQANLYGEIQSTNAEVAYDTLILNRQGGNVAIGNNTAPSYTLDVTGTMRATASITDSGLGTAAAGSPLSVNSSDTVVSGISSPFVQSTTGFALSTTAAVMLTTTPAAGTYNVFWSGNITAANTGGAQLTAQVTVAGNSQGAGCSSIATPFSGSALGVLQPSSFSVICQVTTTTGQAVAVTGKTSAGTAAITGMALILSRVQ